MAAFSNTEINSVIQVKGTPNFLKPYRAMDIFHKKGKQDIDSETCAFLQTLCLYFLTIPCLIYLSIFSHTSACTLRAEEQKEYLLIAQMPFFQDSLQ